MARYVRLLSAFLAAAMLTAAVSGCAPAQKGEEGVTPESPTTESTSLSQPTPAATRGPCLDYDQAMANVTGVGYPDSAWESMGTDEAACLAFEKLALSIESGDENGEI